MDTLENVRHDVAAHVGDNGTCEDDPKVVEAINDARRLVYTLGDWKDTVEAICCKLYCGYATLPPQFEYAKQMLRCKRPVPVDNDWFSLVGHDYCGSEIPMPVKLPGTFATFRDWPTEKIPGQKACCSPEGFRIRLVSEGHADAGAEMSFVGVTHEGEEILLTRTLSSAWQRFDAIENEPPIKYIKRVVKPRLTGRVRLYGWDGANEILLSVYAGDWVDPEFTRYQVASHRSSGGHVIFNAKKRFRPLPDDNRALVDIATEALIHLLQAITYRTSRNLTEFARSVKMATDFLNSEMAGPRSTTTFPIQMSHAYRVTGLNDE